MNKKNNKIIVIIMVLGILVTVGIAFGLQIRTKEYNFQDFTIKYDTTWKVIDKKNGIKLEHKKSGSILNIQCKELEINYIDTSLKDMIADIMFDIEKQNEGYKLIAMEENPTNKYESYSYLYEKDMEQVMVNIYKKDTKLIITYYQADSTYYDIVLDSVDIILDSLEIISGEKVS